MYTEENYSLAEIITAYELSDITFSHPLILQRRYLQSSGDFAISRDADGTILPIRKSEGATVKEKPETTTAGTIYTVTIEFEVAHPTEADYHTLQQLRRPHHLVLSHMGDHLSVVRATEDGWHYEETGEDTLRIQLEIQNPNGQQRVLD